MAVSECSIRSEYNLRGTNITAHWITAGYIMHSVWQRDSHFIQHAIKGKRSWSH